MFYSYNPATSLAAPISSYPGTEMTTGPPIIPPPPDLKPICDKLAEYVARNGNQFEENIRAKNDPRYDARTCLQILLFVEIANILLACGGGGGWHRREKGLVNKISIE